MRIPEFRWNDDIKELTDGLLRELQNGGWRLRVRRGLLEGMMMLGRFSALLAIAGALIAGGLGWAQQAVAQTKVQQEKLIAVEVRPADAKTVEVSREELQKRTLPLKLEVAGKEELVYQERHALLIEERNYETLADLPTPRAEQEYLASDLSTRGFAWQQVRDLKKAGLAAQIRDFIASRGRADTGVLIYITANGWTDPATGMGYVAGIDAPDPVTNLEGFKAASLSLSEVRELLGASKAMHTLLVVDACLSGAALFKPVVREQPAAVELDAAGLAKFKRPAVQALISCRADQQRADVREFGQNFVQGTNPYYDLDRNGVTSMSEVAYKVSDPRLFGTATPQFGWIGDPSASGDFLFKTAMAIVAPPPIPIERITGNESPAVLYIVAMAMLDDLVTPKNDEAAARFLKIAADKGYVRAQVPMGGLYESGKGVALNQAEALRYYMMAADQGDAQGQYEVGRTYHFGNGVAPDDAKALPFYQRAADQGYDLALLQIGVMHAKGLGGLQKSESEAARFFRMASDKGNATAMYNLATRYASGTGVPKNDAEAVALYTRAAKLGYEKAQQEMLRRRLTW